MADRERMTDEWLRSAFNRAMFVGSNRGGNEDETLNDVLRGFANRVLQQFGDREGIQDALNIAYTKHKAAASAVKEDLGVAEQALFGTLWVGDRFTADGNLWTKLGHDTARQHSESGINLGDKGFGYIGDSVCSFDKEDAVTFVPPAVKEGGDAQS